MRKHTVILIVFFFLFCCNGFAQNTFETIDLAKEYAGLLKITGADNQGNTGVSISTGDINGDNIDDMIIGAMYADSNGKSDTGAVYVIFGSNDIFNNKNVNLSSYGSHILKITGENEYDYLGYATQIGDIDNDGFNDLIIGAYNAKVNGKSGVGKVYVIFGSQTLTSMSSIDLSNTGVDVLKISGPAEASNFGYSVAIGDINSDGFNDIIAGAPQFSSTDRSNVGMTLVIEGSSDIRTYGNINPDSFPPGIIKINGVNSSDQSGIGVSSSDINGDEFDDVIIGAWQAGREETSVNVSVEGASYIVFGSADFFSSGNIDLKSYSDDYEIFGGYNGNYLGIKMFAGNINEDLYGDLLVGAHAHSSGAIFESGASYVIRGNSTVVSGGKMDLSLTYTNLTKIIGESSYDHLCNGLFDDINGDNEKEIIVASADASPFQRSTAGAVYILPNSSLSQNLIELSNPPGGIVKIFGEESNDHAGYFLSSGDINGDGKRDLLIGAPGYAGSGKYGKVYVISGAGINDIPEPSVNETYHFKFTINTGNNSTILIKEELPPEIFGNTISVGDEIGVFTPGGLCAGAGIWKEKNLSITVWGDNTLENGINGFFSGEEYNYKIWDASEKKEYVIIASYSEGTGKYSIDGLSVLGSLDSKKDSLTISLTKGWNLISANILPEKSDLSSIFNGINNNLIIVKNGKGQVYWPQYNVNQISGWAIADGYQVYVNNDCKLDIYGYEMSPGNITYNLVKNWNLISYTGEHNQNPLAAFYPIIQNLIILKDWMGKVFWPIYGIDQIEEMRHGNGYWAALSKATVFSFSEDAGNPPEKTAKPAENNQYFNPVGFTGNNATILIKKVSVSSDSAAQISAGDEIGIFSQKGLCTGSGVWKGDNLAVCVWGDDPMTAETDGMVENEKYIFKVFDKESGKVFNADAVFGSGQGVYNANAISVVEQLSEFKTFTEDETSLNPKQIKLLQNFPNPFNSKTTIKFSTSENCMVKLKIYNAIGRLVEVLSDSKFAPGTYSIDWNAAEFPSGLYFVSLETGSTSQTKRLMLLK